MITRRIFVPALAAGVASAAKTPETARPVFRVPFWLSSSPESCTLSGVKVNGGPAKVLQVLEPSADLMVLLVLDLSGDLAQADPAREALVQSIQQLPDNAWIGLLRAQDGLTVLLDPTADRAAVAEKIRSLSISGRAGLLDTVEAAQSLGDRISAKSRIRMAVVYITDSDIHNYREDYSNPVINHSDSRDMSRRFPEGIVKDKIARMRARLATYESPLFVVHLNYRSDTLNNAYQTGLMELATTTGGSAAFCRSIAEIPQSIQSMFQTVASHRVAIIQSATAPRNQADIELAVEGGSDLKYRTRLQMRK